MGTERLFRGCGNGKVTVGPVAAACGCSAANVYRYSSSRRVILDTLASHYLRETERAALGCAIRNSYSARDRLSGFLTGLSTALMIFTDREPRVSQLLADATAEQWACYTHHDARLHFMAQAGYPPTVARGQGCRHKVAQRRGSKGG